MWGILWEPTSRGSFEKTNKPVFRYGLGEWVYEISGAYRFSFGQEVRHKQTTDRQILEQT